MISKDSRKVFDFVKSTEENRASYRDIENKFNWSFDKAKSVCDYLIQENLAVERTHHPMPGKEVAWGIVLTEEGKHIWKYKSTQIIKILLLDVGLPVVVSVIATLITLWLQGLFPIS